MKSLKLIYSIAIFGVLAAFTSCEIDDIPDPNNADQNSIENNATLSDIQLVSNGMAHLMRTDIGFYYDVLGIIGREYYFFTNSDPRYTGEVLGKESSVLDARGFYGTRPYAASYKTIKNANILITATENSSASITDAEKEGIYGLAKTVKSYSYLLALNLQFQNGIRIDVADPDNLGPFLGYTESLQAISDLLDEANVHLGSAGSEFVIDVLNIADTPQGVMMFNRALKARVELYRGDNSAALTALGNSFMDLAGTSVSMGALTYSLAGTDQVNPVYRVPDQSEALVAHASFNADIQAGDTRISKVTARTSTAVLDGLSSDFDVTIYAGLDSDIPIIRNEELILIYAEANIGTDNVAAVSAIDVIRGNHGLAPYAGGTSTPELIDEVLYNRRYSLFGEAHRWIDLRRHDRLGDLPLDRAGDDVWVQFPKPAAEGG